MRKLNLVLSSLLIFASIGIGKAFAAWGDEDLIARSSFTKSNDTTVAITTGVGGSPNILAGGVLDGVVISSNANITFYDSVNSTQNQIGFVNNGSGQSTIYIPFEVRLSSGLTYTSALNTQGLSIIYKVLRPF